MSSSFYYAGKPNCGLERAAGPCHVHPNVVTPFSSVTLDRLSNRNLPASSFTYELVPISLRSLIPVHGILQAGRH